MALVRGANPSEEPEATTVVIEIRAYDPARGVGSWNEKGTTLRAEVFTDPEPTVVISGNPAGLTSLARHLLTLAQEGVPDGRHFDFDTYCGWLAEDSMALRLEVER
ncbi:hypothetical protein [Nonomuraea sp. NPDC005692]|uniref:Imm32 family immunity protein n=1 Tax=Nonomuraea sp. NPDC005692 TaxID=3157168 RepID=UPI0033D2DA0A